MTRKATLLALDVALRLAWIGACAIGSAASAVRAVGVRVETWLESD